MQIRTIGALALIALLPPAATGADVQPFGPDIQINETGAGNQRSPRIAMDAAGNFVVVWEDDARDGDGRGIFARLFDSTATPLTPSFQVNARSEGQQIRHAVAMDAVGNFVVVWQDATLGDGSGSGIFARRFASNGVPLGGDFLVNVVTRSGQHNPDIAMDALGRFVIAWSGIGENLSRGTFGRLFDSGGNPLGDEFVVADISETSRPDLAFDGAGNITVALEDCCPGGAWAVFGQRLDRNGVRLGPSFEISRGAFDRIPHVGVDAFGAALFIWSSGARRYDAAGNPVGDVFPISPTTTSNGGASALAMQPDGRHLVAWTTRFTNNVIVQEFDGTGATVGPAVQVNDLSTRATLQPDIAFTGDHAIAVWTDFSGRDGDGAGIFARRLTTGEPPSNAPPTAVDDAITLDEDTSITFDPMANDTDADGDPLSVIGVGIPAHGVAILGGSGNVRYTPDPDFNGADGFTYDVGDGNGGTDTGNVNVTVNPVNDAPVAVDDEAVTDAGTPVTIDVLANDVDVDVDGDVLQVVDVTQGASGSVGINPDGTITYTPFNIDALIARVQGLAGLNRGQRNALLAKLRAAARSLQRGNLEAAAGQLGAFANQVEAFARTGKLDPATAGELVAGTRALLDPPGSDAFTYTVSDGELLDTATVNVIINH